MKPSEFLQRINRNDVVHFYFKKFDTHAFGCSYVFRSHFRKHEMLEKLDLRPVKNNDDITCQKDAYVFLCDIDLTPSLIFKLGFKAKKIFVIDSKFSTTMDLMKNYTGENIKDNPNITFIHGDRKSPIDLVWELVNGDKEKPGFVRDLAVSYLVESSLLPNDNRLSLMKSIVPSYEFWEVFEDEDKYKEMHFSQTLDSFSLVTAKNICLRNSTVFNLNGFKTLIINANKEYMDEIGLLAIRSAEVAIVYERTDSGYYYSLFSSEECQINFLMMFKKYNCQGFHKRAWFTYKDFIFDKKPSFLKCLFGSLLP